MYIPPLFSDEVGEADTFHRKCLSVADVFVGTVLDTDTLFCLVWFDISVPLNDNGFPVCLVSDFLAALLSEGCAVDASFPGFAVVWSASVFTPFTFSPFFAAFVG